MILLMLCCMGLCAAMPEDIDSEWREEAPPEFASWEENAPKMTPKKPQKLTVKRVKVTARAVADRLWAVVIFAVLCKCIETYSG